MKGKYPAGMSLPRVNASKTYGREYRRFWGRSAGERLGDKQYDAYVEMMGRTPSRFTEGLAKAQWEYGLQGTPYFTKDARQGVLAMTARA